MKIVPRVKVTLVFTQEEAEEITKILDKKYNQGGIPFLEDLCMIAIRREARPTKVNLVGLGVHKKCTGVNNGH